MYGVCVFDCGEYKKTLRVGELVVGDDSRFKSSLPPLISFTWASVVFLFFFFMYVLLSLLLLLSNENIMSKKKCLQALCPARTIYVLVYEKALVRAGLGRIQVEGVVEFFFP